MLLQLSSLLPQQHQVATPALPLPLTTTFEVFRSKCRKLEYYGQLFQITHTSSFVTTLTEESSDVIPLIFRGKQIETTIVHTQTRYIMYPSYPMCA